MNLVLNVEQYNPNFVFFSDPIKNTVIQNSRFFRIVYSTPHMSLNGIYLQVNIPEIRHELYYNKMKVMFDVFACSELIEQLKAIEAMILQKVSLKQTSTKRHVYKLHEQLLSGSFKMFVGDTPFHSNGLYVLKIAGIWETEHELGLTYKFIPLRNT